MGAMRRDRAAAVPMPGAPASTSVALLATGLVMLAAVFLRANPWFGAHRVWPWEMVTQDRQSLLVTVAWALWITAALWAVATAMTPARRLRATGLALAAAVLLLAGAQVVLARYGETLAFIALGGGLLVARRPATRALGRCLAGAGAISIAYSLAATFPYKGDLADLSLLQGWWRDVQAALGDAGWTSSDEHHAWLVLAPTSFTLLSAAVGLLSALGITQRTFLLVGFAALFVGRLLPLGARAVIDVTDEGSWARMVTGLADGDLLYGFLFWVLGAFTVLDLSRLKERAA